MEISISGHIRWKAKPDVITARITVCVVLIQKWKDIRFGKIKNYLRMKCGRISTGKEAIPMSVKWTEEQEK